MRRLLVAAAAAALMWMATPAAAQSITRNVQVTPTGTQVLAGSTDRWSLTVALVSGNVVCSQADQDVQQAPIPIATAAVTVAAPAGPLYCRSTGGAGGEVQIVTQSLPGGSYVGVVTLTTAVSTVVAPSDPKRLRLRIRPKDASITFYCGYTCPSSTAVNLPLALPTAVNGLGEYEFSGPDQICCYHAGGTTKDVYVTADRADRAGR